MSDILKALSVVPVPLLLLWVGWAFCVIAIWVAVNNARTRSAFADATRGTRAELERATETSRGDIAEVREALSTAISKAHDVTHQELKAVLRELAMMKNQIALIEKLQRAKLHESEKASADR